jgi:hypothetical protein
MIVGKNDPRRSIHAVSLSSWGENKSFGVVTLSAARA